MNFIIDIINDTMKEIDKLVETGKYNEANRKYYDLYVKMENKTYNISETNIEERKKVANFYADYSYFLFNFSEFEQFFYFYIKAQKFGYNSTKRREFIYEAFVVPNIESFRENYYFNVNELLKNKNIVEKLEYEKLNYWLLTTGEDQEYYLYDKEMDLIKNKINLNQKKGNEIYIDNLKGDHIVEFKGNWDEIKSEVSEILNHGCKCYIIGENLNIIFSILQGKKYEKKQLSNLIILKDEDVFKKYIQDKEEYLPRLLIGNNVELYDRVIKEIHNKRILEKGNREKILLSICIPSYNRGHRALENIRHLVKSEFDNEIEFVVSNNGTKNNTKESYHEITKINDSRIIYHEFSYNQGMAPNFCKAVDIASGKYILLLSDEDFIDLSKLKLLMNILKASNEEYSIIRVKSDKQGLVPYIGITDKGKESLRNYILTSNYMSGNIYNREVLMEMELTKYIVENLDNEACNYYPHMVWDFFVAQNRKVLGLDLVLVNEGTAEKTNFELTKISNNKKEIPYYASFEGRLGQHIGFFEVIKTLEIVKEDFSFLRELYQRLCNKTIFLLNLSISVYYSETEEDIDFQKKKAYEVMKKCLDDIYLDKNFLYYKDLENLRLGLLS